MFGKKQRKIRELQASVEYYDARNTEIRQEVDRLGKINEARQKITGELTDALAKSVNLNRDSEARIDVLEYALADSKELNRALTEENVDLIRRYELLESLLGQLKISVKFPARKK